ncbi:high choriolytic enzyme 1-like, partial [Megalops cyprinoides]|uniref:high choriolytic enzyme 1-like n=2 Tax=Megalops cyprinoides TaxID=118141 RepID=UPI00186407D2
KLTRSSLKKSCLLRVASSGLLSLPWVTSSVYPQDLGGLSMIMYLMHAFASTAYFEKWRIEYAMNTFHTRTCIRFVPRQSQSDYISIESKDGCYSYLGRTGGRQVVSLARFGCVYNGIIQHELNHALGFYHEHTRSDRDQYVRINWEYVAPYSVYNFQKQDTNNLNTPYDYSSIMHYGRSAFSTQYGQETITPIPDPNQPIGQRRNLSDLDIQRINRLYGCCEKGIREGWWS